MTENSISKKNRRWQNGLLILAQHNFITFLILFFIVLILGGAIGYFYVWRVQSFDQNSVVEKLLKIDAQRQQRVLNEWQKRNENFYEADKKIYHNPFQIKGK